MLRFLCALLLALLPLTGWADTWSFEWNKSHTEAGAQGFYNFGTSYVEQDVYTTELNGITWSIASEGTMKYAYVAKGGQTIGSASEPSTHTSLWTSAFAGKITAVRVQCRTAKDANTANLSVKVGDAAYLCGTFSTDRFCSHRHHQGSGEVRYVKGKSPVGDDTMKSP